MDSMRLFFALWPPEALSRARDNQAKVLARRFGGKPSRRETIHLTLAFLGEIDAAFLPAVAEAGRRVDAAPFELVLDRFDCWRHNGLLWAGCAEPAEGLRLLVTRLREQLRAASIVFDTAPRFVPHLTLVRKTGVSRGDIATLPPEPLIWTCSSFMLVHSRPAAASREYVTLESFILV
jgi:2'-5' RNA ligase